MKHFLASALWWWICIHPSSFADNGVGNTTTSIANCERVLLRGNATLANLKATVQNGVPLTEIPSLPPFSYEQIELLKSGIYHRTRTFSDLKEAETAFFDPREPDLEFKIVGPGLYQARKKGATRWNPIPRETKTNLAARTLELKIEQSLRNDRVSLVEHLSPVQKKAVQYFLEGKQWDQPMGIADIADAIAVARALSVSEEALVEGKSLNEWKRFLEAPNALHGKFVDYTAFVEAIETRRNDFLRQIASQAEAICDQDQECEYPEVASTLLKKEIAAFATALEMELRQKYPLFGPELAAITRELASTASYSEWLERNHGFADVEAVRMAAKAEAEDPILKAPQTKGLGLTDLVRIVDTTRDELLAQVAKTTQENWQAHPNRPYTEVLKEVLAQELQDTDTKMKKSLAPFNAFGNAARLLRKELTAFATYSSWVANQKADMAFGENVLWPTLTPTFEIPKSKHELIKKLVRLGDVGGEADLMLLEQMLGSVDEGILNALTDARYTITIARNNVTNGARDLRARTSASGLTADNAEGVHALDPISGERRILVRSRMYDGKLLLNVGVLLHEIGHAVDLVLRANANAPLHVNQDFVEAFTLEHRLLSSNFQNQLEFMAQVFARYAIDRERTRRELPVSCAAFDKLGLPKELVDGEKLVALHRDMLSRAPVTAHPDPEEVVRQFETLNVTRQQQGKAREPVILEIEGEPAAKAALAKQLASYLVTLRMPTVSPFESFDNYLQLSASDFNTPTALTKILHGVSGGHGTILYLEDLRNIPSSSPGFSILEDFLERTSDLVYVVLAGESESRKPFETRFPHVLRKQIRIDPLTTHQVVELVKREVSNDGYEITEQAMTALTDRASAGGYEAAMKLWGSIKREQATRTLAMEQDILQQPKAVAYVLSCDVTAASGSRKRNAIDEIRKKVGLKEVKEKVEGILAECALARQAEELHIEHADPPRLNLLFAGNPGTGKTSVAVDLAESLFDLGYVKRSTLANVTIQDLVTGSPETNVKRLFEENKDGVIFIDEFHQLKDTPEGKRAFRAMIPYLTHPTYARTVFIGAGYQDEVLEVIREVDPGGERRFTLVPFSDYSREEMAAIGENMLYKNRLNATDEVKQALVESVIRKQRAMKHPGNAGDMEKVIDRAREKQRARLALTARDRRLTSEDFNTLTLDDVVTPSPVTIESVWKEIDALKGLESIKRQLRTVQALMTYNRANGDDVLTGVEPYIILEGPPGSGKTTLAALISRLFAANDIVPDPGVEAAMGGTSSEAILEIPRRSPLENSLRRPGARPFLSMKLGR